MVGGQPLDERCVHDRALDQRERGVIEEMGDVVAGACGDVVEGCDLVSGADQGVGDMRADEARPPGHQTPHRVMLQTGSC